MNVGVEKFAISTAWIPTEEREDIFYNIDLHDWEEQAERPLLETILKLTDYLSTEDKQTLKNAL